MSFVMGLFHLAYVFEVCPCVARVEGHFLHKESGFYIKSPAFWPLSGNQVGSLPAVLPGGDI